MSEAITINSLQKQAQAKISDRLVEKLVDAHVKNVLPIVERGINELTKLNAELAKIKPGQHFSEDGKPVGEPYLTRSQKEKKDGITAALEKVTVGLDKAIAGDPAKLNEYFKCVCKN